MIDSFFWTKYYLKMVLIPDLLLISLLQLKTF